MVTCLVTFFVVLGAVMNGGTTMMSRKKSEVTLSVEDAARVSRAAHTFGLHTLAREAGVSGTSVTRVAGGFPIKRATLTVVVQAADRLLAERSRRLQHSDTKGAA
jgi:hypothetical protein